MIFANAKPPFRWFSIAMMDDISSWYISMRFPLHSHYINGKSTTCDFVVPCGQATWPWRTQWMSFAAWQERGLDQYSRDITPYHIILYHSIKYNIIYFVVLYYIILHYINYIYNHVYYTYICICIYIYIACVCMYVCIYIYIVIL